MIRVHGAITVILCAVLAGCSVVPSESVTRRPHPNGLNCNPGLATPQQPTSVIENVAFSEESLGHPPQLSDADVSEDLPVPAIDRPDETPFSLADVEGLAIQNNPTLAAAAARMAAARGRQVQAGLYPNPVIGYHGTEIGNLGTAGQQGGFVSQRFITGGKLKLDQAAAGRAIRESRFRLDAQQQRVITDVRVRFYEALAAERRVELTSELSRLGDDLVAATKKLQAGRLRTENDLLQAQVRAEEAQILFSNAQNELEEAWRRLVIVVGMPTLVMSPLAGNLESDAPDFRWEDCYLALLAGNPELQVARARASRARILIRRARKEPVPNVDVSVSVRHITPTDSDVANVQLGIPVPVFNRNQGNILAAEAEWIAACREVERIELDLQDRLAVAYRRYANAFQQSERYSQKIVPKAQRSLDLVTNGYEKGQVEYLTLLTSQQTYVQVTLAYINSLRELRVATAIIEGQLLSESLRNPG